ncbi:hypothetical protein IM42_00330 [Fervidobacterium sp. SC_NGM5_O18]|uniref:Uncharacterized protein n=2 Tax=Fervidobacterium pennivorans TaxID=93466 RepID=A0A172T3W0_FERPE|nr:hypothetical protein JM64_06595 [Fervidobacterium pennivorans]PHJ13440.1 hypothetical protein IM42_00330 [Fervidobacterium sp. SC_NGM5_O18]
MRLDRDKLRNFQKKRKFNKHCSQKFLGNSKRESFSSPFSVSGPQKTKKRSKSKILVSMILLFIILGILVLSFGFIFTHNYPSLSLIKSTHSKKDVTMDKEVIIDTGLESRISRVIGTDDGFAGIGSVMTDEKEKYQILLTKIDETGKILWTKLLGADGDDFGYDIIPLDDGFLLLGTTSSGSLGALGRFDAYVIRLDKTGDVIWQKSFGGPDWDRAYKITKVEDNFVFIGDNYEKGKDVTQNFGEHDYWIVSLSKEGKIIWDRSFGGVRWDRAYAVGYDEKNKQIIVAGTSNSFTDGTRYDGYVVSYDTNGNLLWQTVLTNSQTLWPMDLCVTAESVFVAGYVYEFSNVPNFEKLGTEKAFVAKLSLNGEVEYLKTFGENVRIHSVVCNSQSRPQESNDVVYFAGYKYDYEKKVPWYGIFEYDKNSNVINIVEKTIDTEYGMLFSITRDENRNVFILSGSIMDDGKMKGLIKFLSEI